MKSPFFINPVRTFLVWLVLFSAGLSQSYAQGEFGPARVSYAQVIEAPVQTSIRLPGTIESSAVSLIASDVEGIVTEVFAEEGDRVAKGDPLAQLRKTELELTLKRQKAELAESRARLTLLEKDLARSQELLNRKSISEQKFDQTGRYQALAVLPIELMAFRLNWAWDIPSVQIRTRKIPMF